MNLFFFHPLEKKHQDEPAKNFLVINEHPHDTSEGSEFLDDAIRIKEQPLTHTEEKKLNSCHN